MPGATRPVPARPTGASSAGALDIQGQLGDGFPPGDQAAPVQVAGGATDWASVSAGHDHTCARKTDGRLFCWGADHLGQGGRRWSVGPRLRPVHPGRGVRGRYQLGVGERRTGPHVRPQDEQGGCSAGVTTGPVSWATAAPTTTRPSPSRSPAGSRPGPTSGPAETTRVPVGPAAGSSVGAMTPPASWATAVRSPRTRPPRSRWPEATPTG